MMLDATDARDGRVPLAPGSSPTGQAPTGLAASRYDPSRGQSPSRVLVCGGRDYSDAVFVCKVLDQHGPTTIITGDARGADEHARNWARQNANLESYAADWKAHGRAAGPIRNQQMLVEGKPDLVIAFPGGRGTADMVRRAKAAGVWCLDLSDSDTRRMAETSIGSVRSTGSAGRKASHDPDSQHARNMGEM